MRGARAARGLAAVLALLALLAARAPACAFEIVPVVSPGGIAAWLVEDRKNPIVTIEANFAGGARTDPPGKAGLAYLASGLLDEGAGEMDSAAFRRALEDDSISLSFRARLDGFSVSLATLTETSENAFRLLRLALAEPRFDAEPLARVRGQVLAGLRARREDPDRIAGRVWWKAAFPEHPYGRPRRGRPETLARIGPDDLRAFAARAFARDRMFVGVVGDIGPERLGRVLDETFGALPESAAAPEIADAAPALAGAVLAVRRPVPQSVAVFGHRGMKRDDPDWYAGQILFEILAGGFGSRLTREIREKRGLTYGVYAYPLPLDRAGLVLGGVSTVNARMAETVRLVRETWRDFGENGPTEREVRDAKDYIAGSYPLRFTDSAAIAGTLAAVQRAGLGIGYIDRRADLIEAVGMDDLRRAARRLFRADELTFAIVGEPEGVAATHPAPDPDS